MDEKRMGEIALALLRYYVRTEGYRVHPQLKRQLGNVAKATEIPQDELKEFVKIFVEELLEETFGK